MPIHDQSYRHYAGGRALPGKSWTVIAWAGIRSFIRKRMFMGLLIFALVPFIVRAVQLWISSNYPQASVLAPTAETFRQFLEQQDFFVFVITVYVGAGLAFFAGWLRESERRVRVREAAQRLQLVTGA